MEASGIVLQRTPCFYSRKLKEIKTSSGSVLLGRRADRRTRISGFHDDGHLMYYSKIKCSYEPCSSMATPEMKMAKSDDQVRDMMAISAMDKVAKSNTKSKLKKQLKMLKGLSKDLSMFSEMGFGSDLDQVQDKANVISDAAEILRKRIEKLKAEEKELKRIKKEEKARMKASKMQNQCEMSSSSSSESSDSECGEVVDMNSLKNRAKITQMASQPVLEQAISPQLSPITTPIPSTIQETSTCCIQPQSVCNGPSMSSLDNTKKIEVCMGGKCKKSGAVALLQEFERVVGIEGAVSGCKCMGKCGDGPNVRVLNGGGGAVDSVRTPMANPLCIGVGLEDIDMIVANYLGETLLGYAT